MPGRDLCFLDVRQEVVQTVEGGVGDVGVTFIDLGLRKYRQEHLDWPVLYSLRPAHHHPVKGFRNRLGFKATDSGFKAFFF
jgi:hypothetical protein